MAGDWEADVYDEIGDRAMIRVLADIESIAVEFHYGGDGSMRDMLYTLEQAAEFHEKLGKAIETLKLRLADNATQ